MSEWLAVKIEDKNGKPLIVATGYRSPSEGLDLSFLKSALEGFNGDEMPCFFAGDINGWHPELASGPEINDAGRAIVEWMRNDNISLLSDGSPTHFSEKGHGRQIDIWFGNNQALERITEPAEVSDRFGSDHYATVMEVTFKTCNNLSLDREQEDEERLNFGKANWPSYERELKYQLQLWAEPASPKPGEPLIAIDRYHSAIVKAIRNAASSAIPRCKVTKVARWRLNRAIGEALALKNHLQRKLDRNTTDTRLKEQVRRQTKAIRRLIGAEIRRNNERTLRKAADYFHRHQDKLAWQRVSPFFNKKKRRTGLCTLVDSAGNNVIDNKGKAELLANSLSQTVAGAPKPTTDSRTERFWAKTEADMFSDPTMSPLPTIPTNNKVHITRQVMRDAIRNLKWKAPGLDQVSNVLLKMGGSALAKHLRALFQASLSAGYMPSAWKIAVVVPILKEGKDQRLATSYRPISLLSCIGKLLESLVSQYLQVWCDQQGLLPAHQAGFRRNKSTSDPIVRLVCDVALAMARRKKLVSVFLDFRAAFDTVWHDGLRLKLKLAGVPEPILRWTSDFLRGRSFKTKVGNALSEEHPVKCGVPQGSPLSPLLFIIYTADMLPKSANPEDAHKRVANGSYADDAVNWAVSKSVSKACNRLQRQLNCTEKWCRKWRLILNTEKCEVMAFGHTGRPAVIRLSVNGALLKQVSEFKYLGLVLSPLLGWSNHISHVSAKVKWRIGALRGLSSRGAMPQKLCLLFYRVYILSVLTYAAPGWACLSPSAVKRLFELQSDGLKAAMDLPYDADPFGTLYISGQLAIDEHLTEACEKYGESCFVSNPIIAKTILYQLSQRRSLTNEQAVIFDQLSPAAKLLHLQDQPIKRQLLPNTGFAFD